MKFIVLVVALGMSLSAMAIPMKTQTQKQQAHKPAKTAKQKKAKQNQAQQKPKSNKIEVVANISLDGVKSNSRFRMKPGQTALAQKDPKAGLYTELTLDKKPLDGKPGVLMEFVIGKVENGVKTVIATPKIHANLGEKSSVMIGDKKLIVSAVAKTMK